MLLGDVYRYAYLYKVALNFTRYECVCECIRLSLSTVHYDLSLSSVIKPERIIFYTKFCYSLFFSFFQIIIIFTEEDLLELVMTFFP